MPFTGVSSILMIRSPGLSPARNAGVSSIGETTFTRPSSMPTSMPRPPNSPCVPTCSSLNASWSKYGGVRIEAGQHAVDRLGDELLVFDGLDVVALDRPEHFGERAQLVDRQRVFRGLALRDRGEIERQHDPRQHSDQDQSCLLVLAAHGWHSRERRFARAAISPATTARGRTLCPDAASQSINPKNRSRRSHQPWRRPRRRELRHPPASIRPRCCRRCFDSRRRGRR